MADLEQQLKDDRALRNTARDLFRRELAHVRREARPGAIGERLANRVGAKADAASDAAVDFAGSHGRTITAAAIGALAAAGLWFARKPIAEKLREWLGRDAGDGEEGEENPR
ncbi:MAG: hypothetical protein P0Y56_02085 [Candidatus Andeanibacterium colombiense]|uniref:DUF3618 domain-containing protein n=1 Tax=Candidatus Andeanibacterium colombiense TaxID=3121345 RepID=A0AAJ5X761_9SPHN|nr:MAG: hypothetical protein P0Y56_02085 [Sphingomonadaceae bacterium]